MGPAGLSQVAALGVDPGLDKHKIRDETRHRAFEYGVISRDDILAEDVGLVGLLGGWKKEC